MDLIDAFFKAGTILLLAWMIRRRMAMPFFALIWLGSLVWGIHLTSRFITHQLELSTSTVTPIPTVSIGVVKVEGKEEKISPYKKVFFCIPEVTTSITPLTPELSCTTIQVLDLKRLRREL